MNSKPGQSVAKTSKNHTAALAAVLLMTVWGGSADAAEIFTKVTKVGDAGKIELQLPDNAIAMVGDKVRLEVLKSGEDADPIKTRWTIKAVNGDVIEANPDGEPTREPEVGYQAVINTILVQPASKDEEPAAKEMAETVEATKPPAKSESSADEMKAEPAAEMAAEDKAETMKEPDASSKEETSTKEAPQPKSIEPTMSADDASEKPEKMQEAATDDKTDDMGASASNPAPEPSPEPTMKTLETVQSAADENDKGTASSSVTAGEMAKEDVAQAEPEPKKDPSAVTECDTLAAHPFDPEAVSKGVEYEKLDAEAVIAACEQAIADLPDVSRFYSQLTRGLHKAGRYEEAFEATQKGAELGSAHSMAFLGVMYSQGKTVAKDDAKSLEWFEKAAEKGNPGGMIFAAAMYRDGKGTVRNYQRSAELYKMAADLEVAEAMTSLAIFHDRGLGVDKNVDQATSLLLRAYRLKDMEARKLLFEAPGAISMDMRKEIQIRLKADGFYTSAIDGEFGPGTRDALIKFSRAQ